MTPLTTIDFPGRLAAVLFLQGCPWRCSYCHNPHLLPARAGTGVEWTSVLDFLQRRRGLLDGVVFSGGEPTLQSSLDDAIAQVRALGYHAALHTGGMYPDRLRPLLPRLDWVGLDIKAPWHIYDSVTRGRGGGRKVAAALRHVLDSGVANAVPLGIQDCFPKPRCNSWLTSWRVPGQGIGYCRNVASTGDRTRIGRHRICSGWELNSNLSSSAVVSVAVVVP